jgi:membrane protease YdiL (CAAX protease family)
VFGIHADGDRAVVDQTDYHVRSENAAPDRFRDFLFQPQTKLFIILSCDVRSCCANEGRPISFSGFGKKRKLACHQHLSSDILDRAVHGAGIVRKDPKPGNLSNEPKEFLFRITFLDAQKNKEADADFANDAVFNRDRSLRYALNHHPHLTGFKISAEVRKAKKNIVEFGDLQFSTRVRVGNLERHTFMCRLGNCLMNALTALFLALLVGASVAFYLRIFRLVYFQAGGKVVASHFARVDAYLAVGCVTMFIAQCFQSLQGSRGALPASIDTTFLFLVQLGFWVFVIGTIVLSLVLRGMHPSALFGFDRLSFFKVFFLGVALLFAALPLILASSTMTSNFLRSDPQRDTQPIMRLFEHASDPSRRVPLIILAVVIAPISEEFVFRGFLYGVLKRYAGGLSALFFSGLLFALIHMHIPSLLPLFLLGCVLTFAYELSGSLLVPMAMHALFNTLTLVQVFFASR